jgi:hypothetical protein
MLRLVTGMTERAAAIVTELLGTEIDAEKM